jgi:DNA replication protein DnaC
MPNLAPSNSEMRVVCIKCERPFETRPVTLYRFTFPADRLCAVCRGAESAEAAQRRGEILWGQAHIPSEYKEARLGNFVPVPGTRHALAMAMRWSQEFRSGHTPRRGLLFHGPPGAGKTHLAIGVLWEAIWDRDAPSLFLNVPDWLNALRESWYDGEQQPPNPNGFEFVVVDDLGAENSTDWARERIYSLLNHRNQTKAATIITSNLDPSELARRLGRATASRLTSLCATVPVEARSDFRARPVDGEAA